MKKIKLKKAGRVVKELTMKEESKYLCGEYEEVQDALEGVKPYQGGQWNNYSPAKTWKPCCHRGDELIFEHEGKRIFGAREPDLVYDESVKLIIDCVGIKFPVYSPITPPFVLSGMEKEALNAKLLPPPPPAYIPPVIRLDWPDYTAPWSAGLAFWKALWERIPLGDTIVCCMGGHGRTGTCAGSLMIAGKGVPGEEAIIRVKKDYCKSAIENKAQKTYLVQLPTR